MKAFVVKAGSTSLEGLQLIEKEKPVAKRGEILVKMKSASLNYRDLQIVAGKYFGRIVDADTIPLSDGSGEVIAVGDGVTRFDPGDKVVGTFFRNWIDGPPSLESHSALGAPPADGVLAEFVSFHEDDAVHIPANLSYEEAATLPCAGVTAWHALMAAGRAIKAGDTVLTLGTGGVSTQALLFSHAAGARVIVTSSSDEKLQKMKTLGASVLINYKKTPEWQKEVMAATNNKGADCVVEVGGAGTLSRSMQSLAMAGKIGLIGVLTREGDTNPHILMRKCGSLHGIFVGSRSMFEQMNRAIEVNDIHPVIDKSFNFDDALQAYSYLKSQSHVGKVVINF